jgi:hypothetical protein
MKDEKIEKAEISIEITNAGVKRVIITTAPDDVDGQSAAHTTLARIAPQLLLLDAALKAE